jgi:hypothetical protein
VAAGVLASLIVVIGWIVVHRTARRREREARAEAAMIAPEDRLRAFDCFLVEREQLTEAMRPENIHNAYYTPQGILSSSGFRREAAAVRRDFKLIDRPEFNRLDEALSRIPPQQLQADANRTSKDKLADAIRALLAFVQRA